MHSQTSQLPLVRDPLRRIRPSGQVRKARTTSCRFLGQMRKVPSVASGAGAGDAVVGSLLSQSVYWCPVLVAGPRHGDLVKVVLPVGVRVFDVLQSLNLCAIGLEFAKKPLFGEVMVAS